MQRKARPKSTTHVCLLKSSAVKRAAADKLAATIKDRMPAGLAQPALRALASAGLRELGDLTKVSEVELAKLHGIGPRALATLRAALEAQGKKFRTK